MFGLELDPRPGIGLPFPLSLDLVELSWRKRLEGDAS
jgi:hypothetical protein